MYHSSPRVIRQIVERDIAVIERHAHIVLMVDEHGIPVSFHKQEPYGLNIIAVIGKSVVKGVALEKALLLEIGMGRTKPYRDARAPAGYAEKPVFFSQRRKSGDLTEHQFQELAPFLVDILATETKRVMNYWESKDPWVVPVRGTWKEYARGVSYSCASKDHALLAAIIRADRKHRGDFAKKAALINYALRHLTYDSYSDDAIKRMASTQKVAESLRAHPIPPYHFSSFEKRIHQRKRGLFREVVEAFGLVDLEKVCEFDEVLKAHRRGISVDGASIRIKTEREQKGYLVFEFIPHKP